MNYKPDEGTLMAYLYGELDAAETEKVEQYLQNNPHVREQLQQMNGVRKALGSLNDVEVIAPPGFCGSPTVQHSFLEVRVF
jgi:anti-sigma factor RsiW